MGLDINGVRFLLYCRKLGVDFTETAMIGRQRLHLSVAEMKGVFDSFGSALEARAAEAIFERARGYAEPLLEYLGGRTIHSFDKSAYESATHLHDMNQELPDGSKGQYTAVLDGGSLEHVFNFPVAIRNGMEMLKTGGHYLAITPANNFLGHGFYQFSPDLYFSIFTRDNGFELVRMIAFEDRPDSGWYSVKNPRDVNGRVTLINDAPVYLLVVARKIENKRIFETAPQQSDYVPVWSGKSPKWDARLEQLQRRTPTSVKRLLLGLFRRSRTGFDPRFFSAMDPAGRSSR